MKRALVLLGVGITAGLIGSDTYDVAAGGDAAGAMVVGQAGDRLPSQTLSDWVSFGDHVVIAQVESERELGTPPEVVQRGEGLIGRRISARLTTTLWSRAQAPALPSSVDLLVWGWVLQDGKRLPFTSDGAPRLGVGSTYVIPLTQVKGGEWVLLAPSAVLPVTAQTIRAPGGAEVGTVAPLARAYEGRAAADLRRDLAAAEPDPVAARHFDKDPDARWAAVVEARAAGQP